MSTRGSVFETVQIGVETTPGTQVAAGTRIQSFDLDCDPQINTEPVEPQGWLAPTDLRTQKEWTKAGLKGALCFNTLPYLLSAGLCTATSTTTPSGSGTWTVPLGTATGGTFTLTFNGQTTAGIAETALAATIKTALELLSTVGSGNTTVSRSGQTVTITFGGALVNTALALTASGASLTGPDSPYTITPTTTAASATRAWKFLPVITGPNAYKTLSVEKGSASNAESFPFGVVDSLDLDFAVKSAAIKGDLMGQKLTDGITMTSSPSDLTVKAVSPNTLDVYVGSTVLGMTKLTKCFKAMWGWKDRFGGVFTLDTSYTSYTDVVEKKLNQSAQIIIEQDSVANQFMTDLRATSTRFCRIIATGGNIESGYPYRIQITFPFKFRNPKRGDNEGVYAGTYDLMPIYDSTFGGAVEVIVTTGYASL